MFARTSHNRMQAAVFAVAMVLSATAAQSGTALEMPGEEKTGRFVQIAGRRAIVHCGEIELSLDTDRDFSLAAASKLAGTAQSLLTSTTVKLWLDGRDQMVMSRGQVLSLMILEEGPQRIVLRAPFTLSSRDGRPVANAQYDLVCYPEGEIFVTLRVLPLVEGIAQAVMELRFAGGDLLRFERAYDLPLLIGSTKFGPAIGVYWHNGDLRTMGVVGGQMRCVLTCQGETEGDQPMISRSFVISVARTGDELRQRCVAHIQPLQVRRLQSCRAMIERTSEAREIASEWSNWCYSFREGTYNLFVDGPRAVAEFDNPYDEKRHVRVRFVARNCPALSIAGNDLPPGETIQVVSFTPDLEPTDPKQSSAALAAFDVPAHDCLLTRAESSDSFMIAFISARIDPKTTRRLYRIVTGIAGACLGEIRVTEGGTSPGIEISSLHAPTTKGPRAEATLSAVPRPSDGWGRFSFLSDLAIIKNQPDRAVLQIKFLNEAQTLSCQSNLVLRRENDSLALYGYHILEVLEQPRAMRTTTLDLPAFRIAGSGRTVAASRPLRFFYADDKKRIQICQRSDRSFFGYELGNFNRTVHPDFTLCGFSGGTTSPGLVFLGRPLVGTGKPFATESSPPLAMRLNLPGNVSRGQRFESLWKMVVPSSGETNLRMLEVALNSLKGKPVDVAWTAKRITIGDGLVAHRIFELSPSGNPAADDGWCYLLDGGKEMAVIGAGSDALRWPWMFRIRALGFDPNRVRKVFLTDAGAKHAGGARALKELMGTAIHLPASAADAFSVAGSNQDQRTGLFRNHTSKTFESVGVDRALHDGDAITVGDFAVRFLHAPGPSGESGVYAVNASGRKVAFVGNLLDTSRNGAPLSGGVADAHSYGNLDEWTRSLRRLRGEFFDLIGPALSSPLSGTHEISALFDRTIEWYRAILDIKDIDYLLPRPLVAGRNLRGPTTQSIVREDLWGVKEVERPATPRNRPIEIAECLWRVGGGFAGENEDAHVYLLDGGSEMALIGAGSGLHTAAIVERIRALGKDPLDIRYILLPSSHWYEARGASSLRAATRAQVCAHRYEVGALWRGDILQTGLMIGDFSFGAFPPCRVDRALEWGETIRVGKHEIFVLDAPGFHRGSTAFLMTIDGLRFLATGQTAIGDLLLPDGEETDGATGWLDPHWGGNVAAWRKTIERYIGLEPDVILPGQGMAQDEDIERQLRECLARLEQLEEIQKVSRLFPASLFEMATEPVRPDLGRVKPKP